MVMAPPAALRGTGRAGSGEVGEGPGGRGSAETEVDETLKRIQAHKGVIATMIINTEGIPIRTTLDNSTTVQYAGLLCQLTTKARSTVRDIDPQNDLTFLRIRSKKHEVMVAPALEPQVDHSHRLQEGLKSTAPGEPLTIQGIKHLSTFAHFFESKKFDFVLSGKSLLLLASHDAQARKISHLGLRRRYAKYHGEEK
ncbi:Dynein light chain roadblock-type 2 isoform X2 [Aix galericulata]|nr:Dynein light chain roadblock-type 2 isoform X2 [Aix galericulata]